MQWWPVFNFSVTLPDTRRESMAVAQQFDHRRNCCSLTLTSSVVLRFSSNITENRESNTSSEPPGFTQSVHVVQNRHKFSFCSLNQTPPLSPPFPVLWPLHHTWCQLDNHIIKQHPAAEGRSTAVKSLTLDWPLLLFADLLLHLADYQFLSSPLL